MGPRRSVSDGPVMAGCRATSSEFVREPSDIVPGRMALSPGARLGPYEIVAPIGAGGMGEVYRGRDTRLGRDVAIKVLPQHLSSDAGRRERFEREARLISTLNHPHICVLHDVGSQPTPEGTVEFLVMEHIDGETLADRLTRGALPVAEVLRTAMEIADALDKAHRQGVVHRDLKPHNVMLTKSGSKLLDFGLAKLRESGTEGGAAGGGAVLGRGATPGAGASILPTATRDLTTAGTLLGTFQYMAPEQLEGREADTRTDIFAFGSLVYEMATGRRAFDGRSQASLIAAILKEQPRPITEVQPLYPAGLDRVVRACMAKDPDDRVQTARDVRMQLEWVADGSLTGGAASAVGATLPDALRSGVGLPGAGFPGAALPGAGFPSGVSQPGTQAAASTAAGRRRGKVVWLAVPAVLLFGALATGLGWSLRPEPVRQVMRVNIQLPPKTEIDKDNRSLALSPDGSMLAYAAFMGGGRSRLWVRPLDSLQAQPLAGTDGATYPFWSPDGKMLGFFADAKLKKVPAAGGTVQTLCDAPDGRGASWSTKGQIVFAPEPYGGLRIISAAGGAPADLTTTDEAPSTHRLPQFLPDGRHLLLYAGLIGKADESGVADLDPPTKRLRRLATGKSGGTFVPPGYLAFVREGNLLAQSFDPDTLTLTGEPVPIAEKVQFNPARWTGCYAFSETGLLVYQGGSGLVQRRLTWFDLEGREQGVVG